MSREGSQRRLHDIYIHNSSKCKTELDGAISYLKTGDLEQWIGPFRRQGDDNKIHFCSTLKFVDVALTDEVMWYKVAVEVYDMHNGDYPFEEVYTGCWHRYSLIFEGGQPAVDQIVLFNSFVVDSLEIDVRSKHVRALFLYKLLKVQHEILETLFVQNALTAENIRKLIKFPFELLARRMLDPAGEDFVDALIDIFWSMFLSIDGLPHDLREELLSFIELIVNYFTVSVMKTLVTKLSRSSQELKYTAIALFIMKGADIGPAGVTIFELLHDPEDPLVKMLIRAGHHVCALTMGTLWVPGLFKQPSDLKCLAARTIVTKISKEYLKSELMPNKLRHFIALHEPEDY